MIEGIDGGRIVKDDIEVGHGIVIPLWYFGMTIKMITFGRKRHFATPVSLSLRLLVSRSGEVKCLPLEIVHDSLMPTALPRSVLRLEMFLWA